MMEDKEMKASEIAFYIERLSQPEFRDEVERAVAGKDEGLLTRVCKKVGIPSIYITALIAVLLGETVPLAWPPGP